jgi:hypothetical protein
VTYTGGPQKVLNFTVPTGLISMPNTLGTTPTGVSGITTATGTQVNRINRNGVISACGTPKAFPGAITGSHVFDSYTFTACQSFCMEPELDAETSGVNLFSAVYTPSYNSSSIGTNYAGDAGLSTNTQSFGIDVTAGTQYTVVVSDVAGNSTPNTYTIQIPACAIDCTVNQLPIAVAQDVTVISANTAGTAAANIDNGSSDPDGDAITLTQTPAGPYAVGITSVLLTVVDTKGATAQTTANVTVVDPGFSLASTLPSVSVTAGGSATERIAFTPNPGIAAAMTLGCAHLPAKSACSFVPARLPAGSGQTDVVLTVSTTANSAALARPRVFYAAWLPMTCLGLMGIAIPAFPGKRRAWALLLLVVLMGILTLLPGCGGTATPSQPVNTGTPPGTYTVTVTGVSGNLTKTTTFRLTVN